MPFDESANGMVRSEAIVAVFIQKASEARRNYCTIRNIISRNAGHVKEGVTVPSVDAEESLFRETANGCSVDPRDILYVEAHGTSTPVGDPIEIEALSRVYCVDRQHPLLVGSVKSNIGHTEATAGLCSIVKMVLAFETGLIAPNANFTTPNPSCTAIVDGRIKVVTEVTPLLSDVVAVNCFGVAGTISQVILERNVLEYGSMIEDRALPTLVIFSATTEEAVKYALDNVASKNLRREFFALLNNIAYTSVKFKPFRGFSLVNKDSSSEIQRCDSGKREVWYVMTGMGCQWPGMGLDLMDVEIFARSIHRSAKVLEPFGIDLLECMEPHSDQLLQSRKITPAFVSICAIQIALVDVLNALGIVPDGMVGHSTGELVCAYADGCCTAEQTILSAYWRGHAVESSNLPEGAMAAVGMTWEEAKAQCPKDVYPACHNAQDSVTISGLAKPVEAFVDQLKKDSRFVRLVNAYDYGFHCPAVSASAHLLETALSEVIPEPKARSKRWLSTSYPPEEWDKPEANVADASYFVHNLLSPVRFAEALSQVPPNAITIEIGPHFLLQSLLKRMIGTRGSYIGLMKRHENNVDFLLSSIGKLYVLGLNPQIGVLYPPVKYPVPRGTAMISNIIKWNHETEYFVPRWSKQNQGCTKKVIDLRNDDRYLLDHCIDGRALYPAAGYIVLAWEALALQLNKKFEDMPVLIEDFKIHRATLLSSADSKTFKIYLMDVSGEFEIVQGSSIVATGKITCSEPGLTGPVPIYAGGDSMNIISGKEVYSELRINGYEYGPEFQMLLEAHIDGTTGLINFPDKWIPYLDCHLLFFGLLQASHNFYLPTGALSVKIDPVKMKTCMDDRKKEHLDGIPVVFNRYTRSCCSPGVEIRKLKLEAAPHSVVTKTPSLEAVQFVPYNDSCCISPEDKRQYSEYAGTCESLAKQILTAPDKCADIDALEKTEPTLKNISVYLERFTGKSSLLSTLVELTKIAGTEHFAEELKSVFEGYLKNIGRDILYQTLLKERSLRPVLETVYENSVGVLKVAEVGIGSFSLLASVRNYMELGIKMKMTLIHPKPETLDDQTVSLEHIEVLKHDFRGGLDNIKEQDLVMSNFTFGDSDSFRTHIRLLKSLIRNRGFVLLYHKGQMLSAESLLCSLGDELLQTISGADAEKIFEEEGLVVVSKKSDSFGYALFLLRLRSCSLSYLDSIVRVQEGNYSQWVDDLKNSLTRDNQSDTERIWVVAEDSPYNGVIGFVKCLNKEPNGDRIRCVFFAEKKNGEMKEAFDFEDPSFSGIVENDLLMNVFKDGTWGAYRSHSLTSEVEDEVVEYSFADCLRHGDLSSFRWMESPIKYNMGINDKENLVNVCYSALNFRDVMIASGRINLGSIKELVGNNSCLLGFEYSGFDAAGRRVMGMVKSGAMATAVLREPSFTAEVPDHWTLEEAATVPAVYFTCYYGLVVRGQLSRGESILIHSAAGGTGISAIRIALSMNCKVFATVGTEEKRKYLIKLFPEIKETNIGHSRDTSFENLVMEQTRGEGVQVILNSLANEKLLASTRCLADHGRFIEIGKYDMLMDHKIGLNMFMKNSSFVGVAVDKFFMKSDFTTRSAEHVLTLLRDGLRNGVVQPLDRTVFERDQVEDAFRFMAAGKHIGKIILKIQDEPKRGTVPPPLHLKVKPRTYFYKNKSYIVVGGLGGFGIELTKWLIENGANNVVLTSRFGVRTSYHHLCMQRWKKEGANVVVLVLNVARKDEAKQLLEEVGKMAPIGGIFNSAVVLKDGFMDKQTAESFAEVCSPKADATKHLDELSRVMCPALDYFVCFSSISCGKGNAGQTNYGYANSVMERVCEARRSEGLHGLAIQWGIIGDVGVVHRNMGEDARISGVMSQKIKSCLETLSHFLQREQAVVSSYVKAEVSNEKADEKEFLLHLARIFGFKDVSELNTSRSFSEIGMDSILGAEMQQALESRFGVTLSLKELYQMKVNDLVELVQNTESKPSADSNKVGTNMSLKLTMPEHLIPQNCIVSLNENPRTEPIFIVHYSEAELRKLRPLISKLNRRVYGVLCTSDVLLDSLTSVAASYLKEIQKLCNSKPFHLIGYSSASCLALEVMRQSQALDCFNVKSVVLLDGILKMINRMDLTGESSITENDKLSDLLQFLQQFSESPLEEVRATLEVLETLEVRSTFVLNLLSSNMQGKFNKSEVSEAMTQYLRLRELMGKFDSTPRIACNVTVIESTSNLLPNDVSVVHSSLTKICEGKISIIRVRGSDRFLLEEESMSEVVEHLNKLFQ